MRKDVPGDAGAESAVARWGRSYASKCRPGGTYSKEGTHEAVPLQTKVNACRKPIDGHDALKRQLAIS
jgi:hypothetical protein